MKNRFISMINLSGLVIGITCCLLITAYVLFETSFDRQGKYADRTYRITRQFNSAEGKVWLHLGTISPPFGPLLKTEFPEIEEMTRLLKFGSTPMRNGDKIFNERNVYVADENVFNTFPTTVISGNPKTALAEPFSVMLSDVEAKKYFGDEDPLGKNLLALNQFNVKVTGVFKTFPENMHIHPDILVSFSTLRDSAVYGEKNLQTNWGNNSFLTYIRLPKHYDYKKLEARFPAFLDKHFPHSATATMMPSRTTALFLQPIRDIHLKSHLDYEAEENGDITRVYIFAGIGLLILIIACINYMNLSTARAGLRAREIGVRKVVGARRKEIMAQFLFESILLCVVALLLALLVTWLLLPVLNGLTGQHLTMNLFSTWPLIAALALLPVLVGGLSGLYPAIFLSSFRPVAVLKGLFRMPTGFSFRQVLVVFQFAVSITLIICTAIVFSQITYMRNKSLGYDRDHIVTLPYYNALSERYEGFRNALLNEDHMVNVSRSSRIPTGRLLDADNAELPAGDSTMPVKADIKMVAVDYDFMPTYDIKMLAGRNYSRNYGTDTAGFVINEAAVSAIGWKSANDAVGKMFKYSGVMGKIIGVTQNFNFESLHERIVPIVFLPPSKDFQFYNAISVKIPAGNVEASLQKLEKTWKAFIPQLPFEYNFLDEQYDRLYRAESRQATLFSIFSGLAIFIACLGLFGLSAFVISQRIKEVGIRKVLGANIPHIIRILSTNFMKLVLISALIAFPVAWWGMHKWLDGFAYRTHIAWWIFLAALFVAAVIALATVSVQAIKAAVANPVRSLRSE